MRIRWGVAAVAASAWLAGLACTESGTVEQAGGDVRVLLSVSEALAGEQIALLPHYLRTDRSRIDLPSTDVAVGTAGTQQVALDLDLTACLRDPLREALGGGCPIRVAVVLRSATGATVDSQLVGPIDLVPGATATAPTVTLRRFGTVTLRPVRDSLNKGDTTTVRVTVKDRQGVDLGAKPATWSSNAPTVVSVSSTGVATGVAPGVATITAALAADPSVTGTVSIPVRGIAAFGITPDSLVMAVNDAIRPATTITAIGVSTGLTWTSATPTVASVDTSGLITAIRPGRAIIRAQSVADPTVRDSVVALVAGVGSLSTTPDTAVIAVGGTAQLTTTVVVVGGASNAVTYATTAPAIATVSQTGLVTGIAAGTALVRVSAVADPSKQDSVLVNVFPQAAAPSCAAATFLTDTVRTARILTKAGSPYRAPVSLVVTGGATLTIDPGVLLCADGGVVVSLENGGALMARGTAVDPIRFTASNPAQPWGGFRFSQKPATDSSFVTNALLEYGGQPDLTVWTNTHPVVFDSVRFRQWSNAAVTLQRGRISRSTVDTTIGGVAAVFLGQGVTFENTTVRQAPSFGVYAADTVSLLGGRIEGTQIGLTNLVGSLPPKQYVPVRITANRGRPASLEPGWVARVARDSITQTSYLGNATDAIATEGVLVNDTIRVFGHLGLIVTGLAVKDHALLVVRPGGQVLMEASSILDTGGFITFFNGGRLDARGTFARPVLFSTFDPQNVFDALSFYGSETGGTFVPQAGDTSRIVNAIVERGGAVGTMLRISTAGLPVVIDSSLIRNGPATGIQVGYAVAPGFSFAIAIGVVEQQARIFRSKVQGVGSAFAQAVELWGSSHLNNSVIRGNAGDGLGLFQGVVDSVSIDGNVGNGVNILMLQNTVGPLTLAWSDILNNGGQYGCVNGNVNNPVSVGNNWWGPLGANILGPCDATPQLNGPIGLVTPYPAPPAIAPATTAGARAPAVRVIRSFRPYPPRWKARYRIARR